MPFRKRLLRHQCLAVCPFCLYSETVWRVLCLNISGFLFLSRSCGVFVGTPLWYTCRILRYSQSTAFLSPAMFIYSLLMKIDIYTFCLHFLLQDYKCSTLRSNTSSMLLDFYFLRGLCMQSMILFISFRIFYAFEWRGFALGILLLAGITEIAALAK